MVSVRNRPTFETVVPQGSIIGPSFIFDICQWHSNCKLLADVSSLFSVAYDLNTSVSDINEDLNLVRYQKFQWKTSFNPDPNKQVQLIIFSRKINEVISPICVFSQYSC